MKNRIKNVQGGFTLIEVLLAVVILAVLGFVGWKAYTASHHKQPSNQSSATPKPEFINAKEGTQAVTMLPGKTAVKLPSGAWLRFENTGSPSSVPDFVFGEKYVLGDMPNYVPIKKLTKTYDQGYLYTLTNKGCHTERKFDQDVYITVVTSCDVLITSQKAEAPAISKSGFVKDVSVSEKAGGTLGVQKNDPYLFIGADNTRLTRTIDGKKVYLEHGDWSIGVITNFGQGTIKYMAEELSAKQAKSIAIGGSKVEINNINLTCTAPYGPATGCHASLGNNGAVYDKFDFEVHYTPASNTEPKIIDYQE
jgi:prepilin-type N-terminal cleavage/methylation domain-containing protein